MRWLVILALIGCAQSKRDDLDNPVDASLYCSEFPTLYCDVCDPERTQFEGQPEWIETCDLAEWRCIPIPTVGEYLACRDAFARALSMYDCESGDFIEPPECEYIDACGS